MKTLPKIKAEVIKLLNELEPISRLCILSSVLAVFCKECGAKTKDGCDCEQK
jgi:hypothetical protein